MTHDKTGGPAFPQHKVTLGDDGVTLHESVSRGMTLRDYFAGQALAAIMEDVAASDAYGFDKNDYGRLAYEIADAMLKQREGE